MNAIVLATPSCSRYSGTEPNLSRTLKRKQRIVSGSAESSAGRNRSSALVSVPQASRSRSASRAEGSGKTFRACRCPRANSPARHVVFNRREPLGPLGWLRCAAMRILVTNDDGVASPGIKALAAVLDAHGHTVTVFAPTSDRSGAGAAIGKLYGEAPPPVTRADWPDVPGVAVHALDAPPATAVLAACLGAFGDPPELVASGINPGQNTGHLVLHSGTVGAALTASSFDVPGLAVSLAFSADGDYRWETAATFAASAVDWVRGSADGRPRVLNVNVPNVAVDEVKGVRNATLATHGEVWIAAAHVSQGDLKIEFKGLGDAAPGTDVALVRDGYVAVTPLVGVARSPSADGQGAADTIELARVWERILPEQGTARRERSGEPSVRALDTPGVDVDTRRSAMT